MPSTFKIWYMQTKSLLLHVKTVKHTHTPDSTLLPRFGLLRRSYSPQRVDPFW